MFRRIALPLMLAVLAACAPDHGGTADAPGPAAAAPEATPRRDPPAEPAPPVQTAAAGAPAAAAGPARLRGRVAYPSEYFPPMRVCALAAADPGLGFCTHTVENAPHYDLALPAGTWWLLAWPQDAGTAGDPGLLSRASECLGSAGIGCDDHELLEVTVAPGEVREGLDINDWYYDPTTQPPPMAPRGETLEQGPPAPR